jgi:hypothetical protein
MTNKAIRRHLYWVWIDWQHKSVKNSNSFLNRYNNETIEAIDAAIPKPLLIQEALIEMHIIAFANKSNVIINEGSDNTSHTITDKGTMKILGDIMMTTIGKGECLIIAVAVVDAVMIDTNITTTDRREMIETGTIEKEAVDPEIVVEVEMIADLGVQVADTPVIEEEKVIMTDPECHRRIRLLVLPSLHPPMLPVRQ